jgi:hypothetical protein
MGNAVCELLRHYCCSIPENYGGEGRNRTLTAASFEKRKSLTSTQILNGSKPIRLSCQFQAILHYPRTTLELSLQYPFTIPLLEILLEVRSPQRRPRFNRIM